MAITLISSSSANSGGSPGSVVIACPAGIVSGNVLLACIFGDSSATISAPAGWSLAHQWSGGVFRGAIFWKVATGAEPTTYTFTASATYLSGAIAQYFGVNAANPFDPLGFSYGANVYSTVTSPFISPAVTCSVNASELIVFFGNTAGSNFATPSGSTLIANSGSSVTTRMAMSRGAGPVNVGGVAARSAALSAAATGLAIAFILTPSPTVATSGRGSYTFSGTATASGPPAPATGTGSFTFSAQATGLGNTLLTSDSALANDVARPPIREAQDSALLSDSAFAGLSIQRTSASPQARVQVAVSAFSHTAPPGPLDVTYGNHTYEVIVCDQYGVAQGQIVSAVPTEVHFLLDEIGEVMIDFWIDDPSALVLDSEDIPGGVEIQVWRDQQLWFWGVPVSASYDAAQVHVTVQDLLWYFSTRTFGPNPLNLLQNPGFELGPSNVPKPGFGAAHWGSHNLLVGPVIVGPINGSTKNPQVLEGSWVAELSSSAQGLDAYMNQHVPFQTGPVPVTFDCVAWSFKPLWPYTTGPLSIPPLQFASRGLYMAAVVGGTIIAGSPQIQNIDNSTPRGQWVRNEVSVVVPAHTTGYLDVRAYAAQLGDQTWWDAFTLTTNLSVGMRADLQPVLPTTTLDATTIIENIVKYAQDPGWGKNNLAIPVKAGKTGTNLTRLYELASNTAVLDALNEFPSIGVCDFAIEWDATGHYRWLRLYSPAKGSVKYNYPIELGLGNITDLQGAIDGSASATAPRVLGQGSTGSSQDVGYAAFPSYLGGKVCESGGFLTATSNDVTTNVDFFTPDDVGKGIYSLNQGFPIGSLVAQYVSPRHVIINTPNSPIQTQGATLTLSRETIGVGGTIIDVVTSSIQDLPVGSLQSTAQQNLIKGLAANNIPAPRMKSDVPGAPWANLTVGDVVPVVGKYGWLRLGPTFMRLIGITWYPETDEVTPILNEINAIPNPGATAAAAAGQSTFSFSASAHPTANLFVPLVPSGSNPSGYAMPTTAPVGMTITDSDDFTGGSVDTSKWFEWSGSPGAGDYAYWDPAQLDTTSLSSALTIKSIAKAIAALGVTVTAAAWSSAAGGTFTFTAVNTFAVGDTVSTTGITPSAYSSTFTVATASGTQFTVTGVGANPGAATLTSAQASPGRYLAGGVGMKASTTYGGADVMMRRVGTSGDQVGVLLLWPDSGTWPQDQEIDFYEDSGSPVNTMSMTFHWGPILTFTSPTGGTYSGLVPSGSSPIYSVAGGATITGTPHVATITPTSPTTGSFTCTGGSVTLAGTNLAVANSQTQLSESGIDASQWHVWSVRWLPGLLIYLCDGVVIGTMTNPNIGAPTAMNLDIQVEHEGFSGPPSVAAVLAGTLFDTTEVDWAVEYAY